MLASGARREVRLTLRRHPSGGSLYGALDLTGVPFGERAPNGIAPRYRIIGSLRLMPVQPLTGVQAGKLRITDGVLRMPVRNVGNTAEPIHGHVTVTGAAGAQTEIVAPIRIVPRRLVDLSLGAGPRPGRSSVEITLTQSGRTILRMARTVDVT